MGYGVLGEGGDFHGPECSETTCHRPTKGGYFTYEGRCPTTSFDPQWWPLYRNGGGSQLHSPMVAPIEMVGGHNFIPPIEGVSTSF